jgi:hypothetical protein
MEIALDLTWYTKTYGSDPITNSRVSFFLPSRPRFGKFFSLEGVR